MEVQLSHLPLVEVGLVGSKVADLVRVIGLLFILTLIVMEVLLNGLEHRVDKDVVAGADHVLLVLVYFLDVVLHHPVQVGFAKLLELPLTHLLLFSFVDEEEARLFLHH